MTTPAPQKATTTKPDGYPTIGTGYSTGTTWYRQFWSSVEGHVQQVWGHAILHRSSINPDTSGTWTVPALAQGSYWPAHTVGTFLFDTEDEAIEAAMDYFARQRALLSERELEVRRMAKQRRAVLKPSEGQP